MHGSRWHKSNFNDKVRKVANSSDITFSEPSVGTALFFPDLRTSCNLQLRYIDNLLCVFQQVPCWLGHIYSDAVLSLGLQQQWEPRGFSSGSRLTLRSGITCFPIPSERILTLFPLLAKIAVCLPQEINKSQITESHCSMLAALFLSNFHFFHAVCRHIRFTASPTVLAFCQHVNVRLWFQLSTCAL